MSRGVITPFRTGFDEVRPALTRPAAKAAQSDARYFSASSNAGITDLNNLALSENLSSDGMALFGSQSILIDDPGVYLFTYSISFVATSAGSANVDAALKLSGSPTDIPGSKARGGAFVQFNPFDQEFGTVANAVIYRLDADLFPSPFTVDFLAGEIAGVPVTSTHRTLTAHRIAV